MQLLQSAMAKVKFGRVDDMRGHVHLGLRNGTAIRLSEYYNRLANGVTLGLQLHFHARYLS
jgi:hypothetical protein